MAKKVETPSMVEQFAEFKETKNIDKTTMIAVLEESFRKVLSNMFGTDENLDIIMNPDKGDVQIFQKLEVVPDGEVSDASKQISLSDAHANGDPEAEVGEEFVKEIIFADFGRRAILTLRQTLQARISELQKESLANKFKALVGELVSGEVYQTWSRETLLIDNENNELLLPKSESIPSDFFRKGETIRAVVLEVQEKNNNPKVILSRTNENFLRRLFELEVPEIHDGLINIRAVARIPGERAKIAVESYDERIDPVGACVGVKGSRIHGIVRELRNENIDVISYTSNVKLFIERALAPAKVSSVSLDPENKKAEVFLRPEQVSLAIGKGGLNIKLASKLTGYEIDVFRDVDTAETTGELFDDDVYLDEFNDEIDAWVINAIKDTTGAKTAKSVLIIPREELLEKTDLEESTIDHVLDVLSSEFEPEEIEKLRAEANGEAGEEPAAEAEEPAAE